MLSSLMFLQNTIQTRNNAALEMMANADRMYSGISFGNSQPLRPSFAGDSFELSNLLNETKISVANKRAEALEKYLAKKLQKSAPNYGGLDYKA